MNNLKSKLETDLVAILAVTALLIIIIAAFPSTPLRIVLGLPFLILFPGYTLISALFPRRTDLDGIERTALSFGLSIAVVPLIGLILNYTPWGIRLYPILVSLSIFIAAMSVVAWYRRRTYPAADRFRLDVKLPRPSFAGQGRLDMALSVVLVIAIIGSLGTLGYVIASPKTGEKFTEFYILGIDGKADGYPGVFTFEDGQVVTVSYKRAGVMEDVDEPYGRVTVGIVNREHREGTYRVEVRLDGETLPVWLDGEQVESVGPVVLQHDERWEQEIGFAPTGPGDEQKVEFVLYLDGEPYFEDGKHLHLWVDGKAL